jgi:hypothetical protein
MFDIQAECGQVNCCSTNGLSLPRLALASRADFVHLADRL